VIHTTFSNHFRFLQSHSDMFVCPGVEFPMFVGYIYGMIAAGNTELTGFQRFVSQTYCDSPGNSITWSAIICRALTGKSLIGTLTPESHARHSTEQSPSSSSIAAS